MVLGILTAVVACPAIIGTTEAVRHGQRQNNREEHRGRKYHLAASLLKRSCYSAQFDSAPIVLEKGKLWIDTRRDVRDAEPLFPATVNFLEYPGKKEIWRAAGYAGGGEGLVTMINEERHLNWVFVDYRTGEVKYGVRKDSEGQLVGPWDHTKIERRLTFQGWEGFIAVQENDGDHKWALYFDCEDDGLTRNDGIGNKRKRMLEVEVWRREIRREWGQAMDERQERLEERAKEES